MEIKKTIKYHILLGFIIIFMEMFNDYVYGGVERLNTNFDALSILYKTTFYITFFTVYALNYRIVCPKTLANKKLIFFFIGQFSLFFVFAGIRYFIEEILVYTIGGFHNYADQTRTFWYYVFDNSYYCLKAILFSTFMYLLFVYLKNRDKINELQVEQQKAELSALKTQLEPHFLFNTLNVFYTELIEKQPETAKGIHKLSKLLRYLTYDAQKDFMALEKELVFVEDYIFFYKKRFENNLYVNYKVEGNVEKQEIQSLILIHFVENIFKHGIINDPKNPAQLTITIEDDFLIVQTQNKVSNVKNYSSNGIGRENLEKRLQLVYQQRYEFSYKNRDNIYTAYLKIPFKTY